jgi:hypothetical protein
VKYLGEKPGLELRLLEEKLFEVMSVVVKERNIAIIDRIVRSTSYVILRSAIFDALRIAKSRKDIVFSREEIEYILKHPNLVKDAALKAYAVGYRR